ncbi:bifunctional UDP-N-acetylmuramoyl-tripeptide:D-alanyl-D-alanine ligase/alanine racemase [Myroides sp. M-43]|uniref:bifunctional UDP-N-acetylmuramoyl-tripeptide:D-alanyl-D-alanine ligase/alanine racemase n=1 Tax=Myroides oncorhynchi TaxID=2893756 RepID=UPI001E3C65BB|nr:bifunctional UDP-N-acetylmuramoyl-tripeptide:D-alanyl-D-alanine ligase/alanine racemase [Myroides oncorhynchi]MCC9041876.1 bifunctional UDP-N-acetylmuramoyl-tripeptide:D-alanyl-D-alanine ligase/alanine racemase [Myroides oncorhynchi]
MKFNTDAFCSFIGADIIGNSKSEYVDISNISVDSRSLQNDQHTLFFALKGGNHDGHDYIEELVNKGVRYIVISDQTKVRPIEGVLFFKVNNTLTALQGAAIFHRDRFDFPVIGITGSKGKTVVKEWLNFLLSEEYKIIKSPKSYNSQTGVPLSVFGIEEKHNLGIFEVGISTVGEMEKLAKVVKPTIGVFTALTEEHGEGFRSLVEKVSEKAKLFQNAEVIICELNELLLEYFSPVTSVYTWSLTDTSANVYGQFHSSILTVSINQRDSYSVELPFTDVSSVRNIMTCISTMSYLGYDSEKIVQRIKGLYPVELRMQVKNGVNNCTIIDDAYNADYQSLSIALDFLEKHKVSTSKTVILSDMFKSGYEEGEIYGQLKVLLSTHQITRVIGIGEHISKYLIGIMNTYLYRDTEEFLQKVSADDFSDENILVKGARGFRFDRIVTMLEKKTHETVLEVNLTAMCHNLNFYRSKLKPETKVMVMVKAFGYGNGSYEVAKLLAHEKVDYLGVAFADEGIELRKAGVNTKIIVMNPEINAFSAMIAYDLEPEVYSVRELNAFLKVARERNCYEYPIHIKLDTGMHRHGFLTEDLDELIEVLRHTNVVEVKSIFSHLSSSDMPEYTDFTLGQIEMFTHNSDKLIHVLGINPIRHILNTSGIFNFSEYQFDMVRLGIGLYGVGNDREEMQQLTNVSTLKTRIMQIKEIKEKDSVGYGRRFRAEGKTRIATVPIGYADGVHRSWGPVGYVLVNGQKAEITGSICMDMLMINVTNINCQENDEVVIFGKDLPVTIIADEIKTIPYEILTSIALRVKRIFFVE